MSIFSINPFYWGFRSKVHVYHSDKTISLPLKSETGNNDNDGTNYISLSSLVQQNVKDAKDNSSFWLTPYLFNGSLQTMYSFAADQSGFNKAYYGRRILTFPDNGSATIDFVLPKPKNEEEWKNLSDYSPIENSPRMNVRTRYLNPEEVSNMKDENNEKPIVLIMHGMGGGSHEPYTRNVAYNLYEKYGFDVVVLNTRGCSRSKITTPELFCAATTEDVRYLVKLIKDETPKRKIYAVGLSLGASALANYVGEEGDNSVLSGVSFYVCPWDLMDSSYHVNKNWSAVKLLQPSLLSFLRKVIKNNYNELKENEEFIKGYDKMRSFKNIKDFDNVFTGPIFGFNCANEYYRKASPINRFFNIKTPSLIINTLDDPVVGVHSIPTEESKINPFIYTITTDLGGHVAHHQGNGKQWYVDVIGDYFHALDKLVDHEKPILNDWKAKVNLFGL